MDRDTASERVCSAASCEAPHRPPASPPSPRPPPPSPSRVEALILVPLLSLAVWGLIWVALALWKRS
jgi:hypothetical protein